MARCDVLNLLPMNMKNSHTFLDSRPDGGPLFLCSSSFLLIETAIRFLTADRLVVTAPFCCF